MDVMQPQPKDRAARLHSGAEHMLPRFTQARYNGSTTPQTIHYIHGWRTQALKSKVKPPLVGKALRAPDSNWSMVCCLSHNPMTRNAQRKLKSYFHTRRPTAPESFLVPLPQETI
ncbi:hypothetical protein CLAIMM_12295 [Cladophialophora immunda]|nr:hypothetical protein CLAIMM_12295 [Cladophialophora immunda]